MSDDAETQRFYADATNAQAYAARASAEATRTLRERFLGALPVPPATATLLDLGCGPGHDAAALASTGATVIALDASPSMLSLATQAAPTARTVCADLRTWTPDAPVHGVWACASLLHLSPADDLPAALARIAGWLHPGGALYTSFQRGDGTRRTPDGRRFTDLTADTLRTLITTHTDLTILDLWETPDALARPHVPAWINLLALAPPPRRSRVATPPL